MTSNRDRKRAIEALEDTLRKQANGSAGVPFPTRPHKAEKAAKIPHGPLPVTRFPHAPPPRTPLPREPVGDQSDVDEEC